MIEIDELLERASARAGLSDFGDPSFMRPLERLVYALNHEAKLSEFGRKAMPKILTGILISRLNVEHWYSQHPEIDEQKIVAPVFGIGLWRTGSTALGHMLAQDRGTRSLRRWEAWKPYPPPETATEETDPRIAAEGRKLLDTVVPELKDMLPRDPRGPEECVALLNLTFQPPDAFEIWARMPKYYDEGLAAYEDVVASYRYHLRVIKMLQWHCPPRRWFLRTPSHTLAMDAILEVYPDARFVWTHRDPFKSIASNSSLAYNFSRPYLDDPEPKVLGQTQLHINSLALQRAMSVRDRIGDRFFDVSHRRQIADPVAQLRPLYNWLGWKYDESMDDKVRHWQEGNPKGDHRYSADFFGLDKEQVALKCQQYTERFKALL